MYIISGEFEVRSEYKEQLIAMSLKLIPLSKKEPECISYDFFESQEKKGFFLFFERWETREAIDRHFEKLYFKNFSEKFPNIIKGTAVIEIYKISSTEKI